MKRDVRIRGETIRLGQLLKLEGIIESGAEVKTFLSTVPVWVNGEREARRGRKLHVDDIVQVDELELRVTSEDLEAHGYRSLEAGQRVSFVWNGGLQDHGRHHATDVRAES